MPCNICGGTTNLVRDHDHATGYIRGILCELCNSWLAVYEKNLKREKPRGRWKYKAWVRAFSEKIEAHLKCNTGVRYYKKSEGWYG